MRHVFCREIEEAGAVLLRAGPGVDAYHACATYREAGSRKGDNALAAQSFWLDLDYGDDKPYPDLDSAGRAAVDFARGQSLPAPLIVTTGGGLHLYWPLDRAIPAAEWRPLALRWRTLVDLAGLKPDPARTADIASILRPPGTWNFKYDPPRPVICERLRGPYDAAGFLARLGPSLPPELGAQAARIAAAAANVSAPSNTPPASAAAIVDRCAQLAALRDSGGRLPEPEWYAALCLLAHCADGAELAHRWSSGDDRYTPEGTDAKLAHALRDSGPTTCRGFEARNAARCVGCPQYGRITSPIQLGHVQAPEAAPVAPENPALPAHLMPPPPWPFQRDGAGRLLLGFTDESGTRKTVVVYEHPLYVSSIRRGESSRDVSVVVTHWLPHEGWTEAPIPWRDHSPAVVLNLLGNHMVVVTPDNRKHLMDYIYRAVKELLGSKAADMEYDQLGWKGDFDGFLLGREYFKVGASAPVPVGVGAELTERAALLRPVGNYDAWRAAANQMFAGPHQGVMLLASFAAPLMRLRLSEGGIILSAVSQASGRGKTLALTAAKSVWGGKYALDMNRTDTANSRFRSLAVMAHLPIIFDELRNRDPEVIKDFVLSFTDGRDKNRLDGEGRLRKLNGGWSTLLLSASNLSLAQTVSFDGEAAQLARVLEYQMEIPAGLSISDGNNLRMAMEGNCGHAGRDFLGQLCTPESLEWAQQHLEKFAREFEKLLPGTDNRLYVAALAALKCAAILVREWGILEFSVDAVINFATQVARGMTHQLGSIACSEIELLSRYIADNWAGCLTVERDEHATSTATVMLQQPSAPLVMRYSRSNGTLLLDMRHMRKWCTERKLIYDLLRMELLRLGVVKESMSRRNLGAGTLYGAMGIVPVWVVDARHPELAGTIEPLAANVVPMSAIPTRDEIRAAAAELRR